MVRLASRNANELPGTVRTRRDCETTESRESLNKTRQLAPKRYHAGLALPNPLFRPRTLERPDSSDLFSFGRRLSTHRAGHLADVSIELRLMSCDVTTTQLDSVHDFAPLGLKRAVTPLFGILAASTRPTRRHGDLLFRAAIYLPQFLTYAPTDVPAGEKIVPHLSDVRFALRLWTRRPTVIAVATLSLGLGVGATTVMYSLLSRVAHYKFGFANEDRLVVLSSTDPDSGEQPPTYDIVQALLQSGGSFEAIGLHQHVLEHDSCRAVGARRHRRHHDGHRDRAAWAPIGRMLTLNPQHLLRSE